MAVIRDEDHKRELVLRLRRVEGQLRGIQAMIEAGADCEKVTQQLSAARRALGAVNRTQCSAKRRAAQAANRRRSGLIGNRRRDGPIGHLERYAQRQRTIADAQDGVKLFQFP